MHGPGGGACSRWGCLVETPPTATAAGGTHPTGMHSCFETRLFVSLRTAIDVLYTGSQKALACPAGAAPISFSPSAWSVHSLGISQTVLSEVLLSRYSNLKCKNEMNFKAI